MFKQIALAIQQNPDELQDPELRDKTHVMNLKLPFSVLSKVDKDLDMDELECMLANLIFQGLIKGYIASARDDRVLVLAKQADPFPPLGQD